MALQADIDYQIALLTWENAEIDHQIAATGSSVTPYEALEQERSFRRSESTFTTAHHNLVLDVIRDYFAVHQATVDLDIRERELEVAEVELAQLEEKLNIGNDTDHEVLKN